MILRVYQKTDLGMGIRKSLFARIAATNILARIPIKTIGAWSPRLFRFRINVMTNRSNKVLTSLAMCYSATTLIAVAARECLRNQAGDIVRTVIIS